jgi:D-3-phosphoglycerate dehydrogenase
VSRPIVYVPEPIAQVGLDVLAEHCDCRAPWSTGAEASEIPPGTEAILLRTYVLDEARLDSAPDLRVVAKHGVGLDNIDIKAATERKVAVLWTPEANADAVAQHALALILALANRLLAGDQAVLQGQFLQRMEFGGMELGGRVLGVVGLGRIGARVARLAAEGFGMGLLAFDPHIDGYQGPATLVQGLDELLRRSDFFSMHVPLTEEIRCMINSTRLAAMKDTSFLINTARGAVVDEVAVAQALESGQLAGAAIDVFA